MPLVPDSNCAYCDEEDAEMCICCMCGVTMCPAHHNCSCGNCDWCVCDECFEQDTEQAVFLMYTPKHNGQD